MSPTDKLCCNEKYNLICKGLCTNNSTATCADDWKKHLENLVLSVCFQAWNRRGCTLASWRAEQTLLVWCKTHVVNTFLGYENLQAFKTSFLHFLPLSLHEKVGLNGESVSCQEFLCAVSRKEWKLVGNGRRVTEPSMDGKRRQDALRQTGKYNPLVGARLSTSSPLGQKRERERKRKKEVLLQCLLSSSQWCGNLVIPLQCETHLSELGNLNLLKMPRCPFSISSTILELNSLLTIIVSLFLVRNLSSWVDRWKEKHFFFKSRKNINSIILRENRNEFSLQWKPSIGFWFDKYKRYFLQERVILQSNLK